MQSFCMLRVRDFSSGSLITRHANDLNIVRIGNYIDFHVAG